MLFYIQISPFYRHIMHSLYCSPAKYTPNGSILLISETLIRQHFLIISALSILLMH